MLLLVGAALTLVQSSNAALVNASFENISQVVGHPSFTRPLPKL
jgi:hypothetical protein